MKSNTSRIEINIIPIGGGQHEYKLIVLLLVDIVETCVVYFGLICGVDGAFSNIIGVVGVYALLWTLGKSGESFGSGRKMTSDCGWF